MRLARTTALLIAWGTLCLGHGAVEPPSFEQRLAAADEAMAQVADLRADFEQRKKTALLRRPLVSRGAVVCKGESMLWTTASPHAGVMLVSAEGVTLHYPDDNLAEVYPADARFADAAGGPLPGLAKLREQFEIREMTGGELEALGLDPQDLVGRVAATLTPVAPELERHVARVQVVIDTRIPCADRVIITDPDGDVTDIRFSNVRINTGVRDADLELRLPPGTRISHPAGDPRPRP